MKVCRIISIAFSNFNSKIISPINFGKKNKKIRNRTSFYHPS